MIHYYDTCAIVKLYKREDGTDTVISLFDNEKVTHIVSELIFVEFYSTIFRLFRQNEYQNENEVLQVISDFEADMINQRIVKLDTQVINAAKLLIKRHGSKHGLKTYDALHLATFSIIAIDNEAKFISADNKLCKVAELLGYDVVFPKDENIGQPV